MSVNGQDFEDRPYERSVFRVEESANYCCQWCGHGAETFEDAFPKGCVQCGSPAEKYDKEVVMREFPDLDKSFFIVNANDTKDATKLLTDTIKDAGGKVVTLEDLLPNGIATREISKVLETATVNAPWVVFVPSPKLDEGTADDFVLDIVMNDMIRRGKRKSFPAYVNKSYVDYAPAMMSNAWGVVLNGGADEGMGGDLENFKRQLPRMIDDISSRTRPQRTIKRR